VGVYLNEASGQVQPPENSRLPQNHYVLIFKQAGRHFLYNSGVLDNQADQALMELNPTQVQAFLYQTQGSIDALTKLSR